MFNTDLERSWLLKQLGMSNSNLSMSDLQSLLYSSTGGLASNRVVSTGRYYSSGGPQGPSTNAPALDQMVLVPFDLGEAAAFDRISCEVTTAGTTGNVTRMGLYRTDSSTGLPNTLIVDGGTVASVSTGGKEVNAATGTLNPGLYWAALVSQVGVAAQYRADNAYHSPFVAHTALPAASTYASYVQAAVSGALPASIGSITANSMAPKLFLRAV